MMALPCRVAHRATNVSPMPHTLRIYQGIVFAHGPSKCRRQCKMMVFERPACGAVKPGREIPTLANAPKVRGQCKSLPIINLIVIYRPSYWLLAQMLAFVAPRIRAVVLRPSVTAAASRCFSAQAPAEEAAVADATTSPRSAFAGVQSSLLGRYSIPADLRPTKIETLSGRAAWARPVLSGRQAAKLRKSALLAAAAGDAQAGMSLRE